MRYAEFKDKIEHELREHPRGLTWAELKSNLDLPYKVPCYTWIRHLEDEIGLRRTKVARHAVWKLR